MHKKDIRLFYIKNSIEKIKKSSQTAICKDHVKMLHNNYNTEQI